MVFSLVPQALALDPHRLIGQYLRDSWDDGEGYPGGAVNAIAQTPDGYLWIGAQNGLVRFDGLSFHLITSADAPVLPSGAVSALATDSEGGLWILLENRRLVRLRRGVFERVDELNGATAMSQGVNRDVMLYRPADPMRYRDGKLAIIAHSKDYSDRLGISINESADGTTWIGTRDFGVVGLRDGQAFMPRGLPDRKVNCILPLDGGTVWVGTDHGIATWNGAEFSEDGVPSALRRMQFLAMARDRNANLWLGTGRGLVRRTADGKFSEETRRAGPMEPVSAVFEDREGNLWVGRPNGIERFRDSTFLTYDSAPNGNSGNSQPIYADSAERTWYGPSAGGLFYLKDGQRFEVTAAGLGDDVVYSIDGGAGEVWVGRQRGGLTRLWAQGGELQSRTWTAANGLAKGPVYTVHRSPDGTVWAGTLEGGLSRLRGGRITTYTAANGLASNTITAIEEGTGGVVWVATANGLNSFDGKHWQVYMDLPLGRINCLTEDASGVLWIGTDAGLAYVRDGRVQAPRELPDALMDTVLGIADDGRGWLWIATSKHVLRVSRAVVLEGSHEAGSVREFGPADGIPVTEGVRRDRSVVRDTWGRIWISLRRGISVVDPASLSFGPAPAIVRMESVTADGNPPEGMAPFRISLSRKRIRFEYLALSLAVPERVRYRYRLDGFDHDWSEPVAARDTVYMNLAAGTYRFRVIASDSDGVWNSGEAAVAIEIVPALWQTFWFRALAVLACLLAAAAIYRLRLRRLTERLSMRFEERLGERTRIAQELHDTLLQGLVSASMQLHVAVGRLPADSPALPQFTRILQLIRQVVDESRNAVRGLRSSASGADALENALSKVRNEYAAGPNFRVIVDGQSRPLNPLIRDEVYRIGREALSNAFRHSGASTVEMEIRYETRDFHLAVRDSGRGIDEQVLRAGREGHWGLIGMRERAEKIGGRLKVWSRESAGTELELTVPGQIAFPKADGARRGWLPRRWRGVSEQSRTREREETE
jgi:signal transduction histidine kinase/ligand-binding sensor domain-containing protein